MFSCLDQKRVLITGASSGIGAASARLFSEYGAILGIHYNSSEKEARDIAGSISSNGGKVHLLKADLLDRSACSRLVDDFASATGGIDILVNNAGAIIGNSHFSELDYDDWDKTIALNLTSPFIIAKSAFGHMMKSGGGRIINISSISAKYGGSERSIHYGAAKAGIEAVTKSLARAGAPYNILVNAIQPGVVDTPAHKKIGRSTLDERIWTIPLKRAGTPLDIARMCLFLGSEGGNYITGQVYCVSGGD